MRTSRRSALRLIALLVAVIAVAPLATAAPGSRGRPPITIKSASDASPGVLDARTRMRHGQIARRALLDVLRRSGADVRHAGMPLRQLDISIVAWRIAPVRQGIDVSTELRVVICDERGKILSIVTGRARVSAPDRKAPLVELREQALAEAVGGMTRSLLPQFARAAS
jgi:hypothetical protein